MDAATAALIGAGTAACVGVGAQFIAHSLALKRDRRNQRRERLFRVIVEAATALYAPIDEPDHAEPDPPPPHPESLAALHPHLMHPRYRAFTSSTCRGITLLQIHFGHDHELIDAYLDACGECSKAVETEIIHFAMPPDDERRLENVPEMAASLRAGQVARDAWMKKARGRVESL